MPRRKEAATVAGTDAGDGRPPLREEVADASDPPVAGATADAVNGRYPPLEEVADAAVAAAGADAAAEGYPRFGPRKDAVSGPDASEKNNLLCPKNPSTFAVTGAIAAE